MIEIKWTAFGDSEPLIAEKILVAWMKCGEVEEAIGPFTYVSRTHFDARFTHWCPALVLPPVPAKRDYCREAFLNETTHEPQAVGEVRRFYYPRLHPTCSSLVTYDEWVGIWSIAIACAKENGLEKV